MTAPTIPVSTEIPAASEGSPPICGATASEMAVVADFVAIERSTASEAPSMAAVQTAAVAATTAPAPMLAPTARAAARTCGRLRWSGTASATVAGPSSKARDCTLAA